MFLIFFFFFRFLEEGYGREVLHDMKVFIEVLLHRGLNFYQDSSVKYT